jgi:hypothetical protein
MGAAAIDNPGANLSFLVSTSICGPDITTSKKRVIFSHRLNMTLFLGVITVALKWGFIIYL